MHAAPPLGHSSPDLHEACLSPQSTEQPPQVPRGEEAEAVQELVAAAFSEPDAGSEALGGPASLYEGL
jgi:hypothetical protein